MVRQSYVIPCLLGVFLGLMLYGVQISLAAMNLMVAPQEPITACRMCKIADNIIEIQVLGKTLHISSPISELTSREDGTTGQIKQYFDYKYSLVNQKVTSFSRETADNVGAVLKELMDSAGSLYHRGLELYTERTGNQ